MELAGSSGGFIDFTDNATDFKGRIHYDNPTNTFQFLTNGTERLRIDSTGNVGIGTTSPAVLLNVRSTVSGQPAATGTTQTSGGFRVESSITNLALDMGNDGSNSANWIQSVNKTDLSILTGKLLLNPIGGNVGIGTSSPDRALHVAAATSAPQVHIGFLFI